MNKAVQGDANSLISPGNCMACDRKLCMTVPAAYRDASQRLITMERGDRLTETGGNCYKIWNIVQGAAAICTSLEDGRRQVIGLEFQGDSICGLLNVTGANSWLEAVSDCWICEIDLSVADQELHTNKAFMDAVFSVMNSKLQRYSTHIVTLGQLDGFERVLFFLTEMAQRLGRHLSEGIFVDLPMSREEIADYLGLNTETVSRIFSRIRKSGAVTFVSPTELVIPDLKALKKLVPIEVVKGKPKGLPINADKALRRKEA